MTRMKSATLSADSLTAGQPTTLDPLSENYRQLLHAVILQAWLEAHSRRHPRLAERARCWLSQPETHALGAAIGVELP